MSWTNPAGSRPEIVFLVGPAHSGKTEVAASLRQAGTLVVRRAYFWRNEYGCCGPLDQEANVSMVVRRLSEDEFLRSSRVTIDDLNRIADVGTATYGELFLHATLATDRDTPRRLVLQIGGLEHRASAVLRDLPDATFVHAIRDPRRYFGEAQPKPGRLGWRLAPWSSSASAALRNSVATPDRYLIVRAEDLIERPEGVASRLSARLGTEVDIDGASDSLSAKGVPLSTRRSYIVERLIGDQLAALGYAVEQQGAQASRPAVVMDAGMYHLRKRLTIRPGEAV